MFLATAVFLAPMQSALFGLTPVNRTSNLNVEVWPSLHSPQDQNALFTGESVNQAKRILMSNASLPAFATEEYAVSPLTSMTPQGGNNEIWILQARVYWAEPSCLNVPAYHAASGSAPSGTNSLSESEVWTTTNITLPMDAARSPSCELELNQIQLNLSIQAMTYLTWNMIYHGYGESKLGGTGIYDNTNCTTFRFFVSLDAVDSIGNETASFHISYDAVAIATICKADCFFEDANVTLLPNGSVISVNLLEDNSHVILNSTLLDTFHLEESISDPNYNEDFNHENTNTNETSKFDAMLTFAAIYPVTVDSVIQVGLPSNDHLDSVIFKDTIINSYKVLVALSIAKLLSTETRSQLMTDKIASSTTNATINGTHITVAVSQEFALASEVILGCSVVVAILDLMVYLWRRSLLRHDPDSLAALLAFIDFHFSTSGVLQRLNPRAGITATPQLKQVTAAFVCQLSKMANGLSFEVHRATGQLPRRHIEQSSEKGFYQSFLGLTTLLHYAPYDSCSYSTVGICVQG